MEPGQLLAAVEVASESVCRQVALRQRRQLAAAAVVVKIQHRASPQTFVAEEVHVVHVEQRFELAFVAAAVEASHEVEPGSETGKEPEVAFVGAEVGDIPAQVDSLPKA